MQCQSGYLCLSLFLQLSQMYANELHLHPDACCQSWGRRRMSGRGHHFTESHESAVLIAVFHHLAPTFVLCHCLLPFLPHSLSPLTPFLDKSCRLLVECLSPFWKPLLFKAQFWGCCKELATWQLRKHLACIRRLIHGLLKLLTETNALQEICGYKRLHFLCLPIAKPLFGKFCY